MIDHAQLHTVMAQLAALFPDHAATLVLRNPLDSEDGATATADDPFAAGRQLNEFALKNFQPEQMHS